MPNHLNMPKTEIMGAILVSSELRNSYMNIIHIGQKWLSYEPKNIYPYLCVRTNFDRFWRINWSNINIFNETNVMKGKPKYIFSVSCSSIKCGYLGEKITKNEQNCPYLCLR